MLRNIIKAMRPKQWVKNIFIFAGIVFDRKLGNVEALSATILGAILFSLLASAIYLVNDISDIKEDRRHPAKKNRPIASGALPLRWAWGIALILFAIVFVSAFQLSKAFLLVCGIYAVLNLVYSRWLKHIVILDVLILASFYVIRVVVGTTLISVERFSPWLYLATIFLALFLGVGKRRAEMINAQQTGSNSRKVLELYTVDFLDQIITIVLTSVILTYSLYTFSATNLPENHATMLTIPFVIYGVLRYLYLLQVKGHGETPEDLVLADRPFQINIALWAISILIIFYFF
jgi:4-hydroxybenzoate polyprenyltransferase